MSDDKKLETEVDTFRDTPVRYLGYANEIGEAFRCIIPESVVLFSYVVATGYVLADTIDGGLKACRNATTDGNKAALLTMADTLLWQSFASVIIPGFTINRICSGVYCLQKKHCFRNKFLRSRWLPTFVGLATIPLIIHPIDHLVENLMNITYRRWVGDYSK